MKLHIMRYGLEENKKRQWPTILLSIGLILLVVVGVVCFSMRLESYIRPNISAMPEMASTWTSSLPSYWGGIIGGMISGLIALIGTFLIIRYYKKSDTNNKIAENCPFIKIEKQACSTSIPSGQTQLFSLGKGKNRLYIQFSLNNIGKGYAQTLAYYDGTNIGGKKFSYTLEAGKLFDRKFLVEILYNNDDTIECSYAIMFLDCFGNEYLQEYRFTENTYEIKEQNVKMVEIESFYPKLTSQRLK